MPLFERGYSGLWTPALNFGGAAVGITYGTQAGFWRRRDGFLWFTFYLALTNKGSSTGPALITGLPIASVNRTNQYMVFPTEAGNLAVGVVSSVNLALAPNASQFSLVWLSAGADTNIADTHCNNTSYFIGTGTYEHA